MGVIQVWDAVVVGLGGVGSFCLRALARQEVTMARSAGATISRQKRILGLEAFVRGHDRGSSHGGTRIYRRAYFEHANYVPWIEYSLQEFRKLEQTSGVSLMQECGTLLIEPQSHPIKEFSTTTNTTTDDNSNKSKSFLERAWDSARQHNIPVKFLSNDDLKQQFPQFVVEDNVSVGLLEPGGGFLRPEEAMLAALQEAEQQGATLWEHKRITSIREVSTKHRDYSAMMAELEERNMDSENDDGNDADDDDVSGTDPGSIDDDTIVQINLQRADGKEKTILAKTVLVAAGAWTGSLVPSLSPYIKVTRQIQGWLDMGDTPDPSLYHPSNMPTWVMVSPHVKLPLYGVPADPNGSVTSASRQQHWIKVGLHGRKVQVDPTQPPSQEPTQDEIHELERAYVHGLSNTQQRPCVHAKSCYYSMTPDHHFIIGVPQGYSKVCVVAGLSGHGFKMTPALGQMLADFSRHHGQWNKVEQEWNTQFCSPGRFGV